MGESFIQWVIEDDFIAGRPGVGAGRRARWSTRSRPTKRPRSASSTPATAASPGPARWSACSYIHEGTHDAGDPPHGLRLRHRRRDPVPDQPGAQPDRPAGLPRRGARALRQPGHPRHQPARRDGRLLEDPGLHRADGARAAGARRVDRQRGDAAGAVPRLPAALAPRRSLPYAYQDQAHGRGRARTRSATRADPVAAFCADAVAVGRAGRRRAPGRRGARGHATRAGTSSKEHGHERTSRTTAMCCSPAPAAASAWRSPQACLRRGRALQRWSTCARRAVATAARAARSGTPSALHYVGADVTDRPTHRARWSRGATRASARSTSCSTTPRCSTWRRCSRATRRCYDRLFASTSRACSS